MKYSLEDFETCVITNYVLPNSIKEKIDFLSSKLGVQQGEHKRNHKKHRPENKNDLWEKAKPAVEFKKTVMKEKLGIDKILSSIKISLNKLNVQNYDKEKNSIFEALKELKEQEEDSNESVLNIFLSTSQLNPFYSKFYVQILNEILNEYSDIHELFLKMDVIDKYKESLSKIEYVDSNEDFNKHCMINKENDKRKGLCVFLIELVKQEFYDEEILYEIFNYQIEILEKNEDIKENMHINEEVVENMLSLLKEGKDVIKAQDYFNNIKNKVRDCKEKKNKEGISKRAIFKFMDMCDSF
tara:strand:- start:846 stop:1739 length:894 start_codon:yes stop_codon:yes gene_type:complete